MGMNETLATLGIKLELKDWKDLEASAINELRRAAIMEKINVELLACARIEVCRIEGEAETKKALDKKMCV